MRAAQVVLLAAILAVLSVLAHDLHRIAYAIPIVSDRDRASLVAAPKAPETRAERDERIRKQTLELDRDAAIIWSTGWDDAKKPATKPTPTKH